MARTTRCSKPRTSRPGYPCSASTKPKRGLYLRRPHGRLHLRDGQGPAVSQVRHHGRRPLEQNLLGHLSGLPAVPVEAHLRARGQAQTTHPHHLRCPLPPGVAAPAKPAGAAHAAGPAEHGRTRLWEPAAPLRPAANERAGPGRGPQNHAAHGCGLQPQKAAQVPVPTASECRGGLATATPDGECTRLSAKQAPRSAHSGTRKVATHKRNRLNRVLQQSLPFR